MDIKIKVGDWYVDNEGHIHTVVAVMLDDFGTKVNGTDDAMYRFGDETEFKFDMENGIIVWGVINS